MNPRYRIELGPTLRIGLLVVLMTLAITSYGQAEELKPRESGIRGRVVDLEGEPIPSVQIHVIGKALQSTSDNEGFFEIEIAPGSYVVEARETRFAVERADTVIVEPRAFTDMTLVLTPATLPLDEVSVTASFTLLREETVGTVALNREQILNLPHFGDDLFRATSVLPGISQGDISARFSIRGGLYSEALVRLDGVELLEPFHLKDFQGVFSILDPSIIDGMQLIPGGYSAEYGDRMSGVLEMHSIRPHQWHGDVGISFTNAWIGSSGSFAGDKGRWLGSLRRGYLDIVLRLAGDGDEDDGELDPEYWDGFAKLEYDLNPQHTLSLNALLAGDSLRLYDEEEPDEIVDIGTEYNNLYFWASHQITLGSRAFANTVVNFTRVKHDRDAYFIDPPDEGLDIIDTRGLDLFGLRQDWNLEIGDRHYLKAGFEIRRSDVSYEYRNAIQRADPIDDPRFPPGFQTTAFSESFSSEQYSLYFADRMRLGSRLTAELGVRYDEQTLTEDRHISPRIHLVYDLGRAGLLRLGWGHYLQSQKAHELDVQFGETEFQDTEQSEHWTLGYETRFASHYSLRLDAYRRNVDNPRVRYETLFDPFHIFPEINIDLIRVAADRVLASGVELYLSRRSTSRFEWWLSYTLSSVEDEIDGQGVPRFNDQTHALTASASFRPSRKWNLTAVWTYHTGWPTTAVSGELEMVPGQSDRLNYSIGPFYAERHPGYHRLDLRASRKTDLKKGTLTFFIDVQNLYDRENIRGVSIHDPDFEELENGRRIATFGYESWLGILPSFGVSWQF